MFIAEKVTTHQTYAMKFSGGFRARPDYLSRFEREIQSLLPSGTRTS